MDIAQMHDHILKLEKAFKEIIQLQPAEEEFDELERPRRIAAKALGIKYKLRLWEEKNENKRTH